MTRPSVFVDPRALGVARRTSGGARVRTAYSACVLTTLAGACLPHGVAEDPPPPQELPEAFTSGSEAPGPPSVATPDSEVPWWVAFEDPALTALIEQALDANLELGAAWARVDQARALARQAKSARWPRIDAQGVVSYADNPDTFGSGRSQTTRATASLPVSYEVDLFARYRAQGKAAELEAHAARAAFASVGVTLAAEIAERWYDLVTTRAQRELLAEQLELNETFLELVSLRFQQGLTSALDVHQQRQQVVATRARLALIGGREAALANQLAVLVGREPGTAWAPPGHRLPEPPPLPNAGIPAGLLESRPDVRAARRQVEAADYRVGSAIAARLPSLRLAIAPGYTWTRSETQTTFIPETTAGYNWSAEAALIVPLFDGFRRKAEVNLREAQLSEALANYGQVLRRAIAEVQTAIEAERAQAAHIEQLEEQVEVASQTLEAARDRYRQGLSDFLPVLTALEVQQQAELALLDARRQLVSQRIQLHRALGGAWATELPEPEEAVP